MKIKTTKKLNLPELIQYVWENDIGSQSFESKFGVEVIFGENRAVIMNHFVGKDDTFTVEVEEEITEGIRLDRITIFFYDTQTKNNGFGTYRDLSIQEALEMNRGTLKFISMAVDDVLIWSRESGIPESGVLEADDE